MGSGGQWRDEKEKKKKELGEPGKNTLGHRIYGQKRTKLGVQWFIRATLQLPVPRLPPTPLTSNVSSLLRINDDVVLMAWVNTNPVEQSIL